MAARESQERFIARRTVREIALQHALDGARGVRRLDVAIEIAGDAGLGAEAATDEDVKALDRIGLLTDIDLAGDQADIADVMPVR